ncbi:hypothetical protein Sru01_46370 [Sphaerisporangium rufum]|uniref:Uncharacterized protein n=1 Tax=Sphaerisporangium rufum TaxID=1381558 RepID=A0A919R983_9ACTN|nr:hypothetical protein [Sphaerisporangium rufum]GII79655.1 hypothetical protein Sru01_46370 [Sphaerisporangium rufum]
MVPEFVGHVVEAVPVLIAGAAVWSVRNLPGRIVQAILGWKALSRANRADIPAVMEALARWDAGSAAAEPNEVSASEE